jgi:hypothetical protein
MNPQWNHPVCAMPVNFSVKKVPDALARRLRERAERNHRSLQQELLSILEAAADEGAAPQRVFEPKPERYSPPRSEPPGARPGRPRARLTLDALWERARRFGGPLPDEPAVTVVRRDRDDRGRH